jgi:xylulose-5-phosphate/fructose-6-phosphate phosphoketolase
VLDVIPKGASKRMGVIKDVFDGYQPLDVPDWLEKGAEKGEQISCMQAVGGLLSESLKRNPKSLRVFSPDELESNKLDAVLEHTGRNSQWDQYCRAKGGRVIEILSEHTCQGFMQGYTLTGRTGVFPSYESFLGIVHTMMVQYSKFRKIVS